MSAALESDLALQRTNDGLDPSFGADDSPLSSVLTGIEPPAGRDPIVAQAGCQLDYSSGGGSVTRHVQVKFLEPTASADGFRDLLLASIPGDGTVAVDGLGDAASYFGSPDADQPFGEVHVVQSARLGILIEVTESAGPGQLTTLSGARRVAQAVLSAVSRATGTDATPSS